MKRSSRGWILLPVVVVAIVGLAYLLSNYQKEAGLSDLSRGGLAAVAAAATARDLASGEGAEAYAHFGDAYLAARGARNNAPAMNAADTRLDHLLLEILDCLTAAREAWQAELENSWDPAAQGVSAYWAAMHPSLAVPSGNGLTPADIRRAAVDRAGALLEQALRLAG